ncbi:Protein fem-1 B [Blomia tropicalis]|nr:Protein fem-1 B [Blomia tropicalis]
MDGFFSNLNEEKSSKQILASRYSFNRFNKKIVNVICQSIITTWDAQVLKDQIESVDVDKDTVNINLNLCSVVFDEEDNQYLTYSNTLVTERNQMSPFQYAVYKGNTKLAKFLLDNYEIDLEVECFLMLDEKQIGGICALWIAVSFDNCEMVSEILRYGPDVNHFTTSRSTPLRVASYNGNASLVKMLIKHGADVNLPNQFQNTCLMLACYMGSEDVVRTLIECKADIDKQALCGATALHFSAQKGHVNICKLLLSNGAKFLPNNNGLTPIFVAAEHSKQEVVALLYDMVNVSFQDYITICELLGAGYATTPERLGDFDVLLKAYTWLKNAFILRYTNNSLSLHDYGCGNNDCANSEPREFKSPIEIDPDQIPVIAKQNDIKPIPNYENHIECQTLHELNLIRLSPIKMLYECFVILERILGPKNLTLAEALIYRGAEFADNGQFAQACQLWLRGIQIKINLKVFIGEDCLRFIRVLERMINERSQYCDFMEQLLSLTIQYYMIRPRLFGYRKLCFRINVCNPDEFEEFTFSDLKRDAVTELNHTDTNMDIWNKVDCDLDSDQVMLSQLYMCSIIAKYKHKYPLNKINQLQMLVRKICKLNVSQNITGRSLLHLAMSNEPDEEFHYNNRFNNLFIRYPSVVTAHFLIQCGADVTATDIAYNTPLHYFSAFCIRDSEARADQQFELFSLLTQTKMSALDQVIPFCSSESSFNNDGELKLSNGVQTDIQQTLINRAQHFRCPPYYGGEFSIHIDAVNVLGQTPIQASTSLLSDIMFGNLKKLNTLKCLSARAVHQRYLICDMCRNKSTNCSLDTPWLEKYISNQRIMKLLRYNHTLLANLRHRKNKNGLEYLNHYCCHSLTDYSPQMVWHTMNRFANKLSISVELAQFVEMHGPCKFIHYTSSKEFNHC